MPSPSLHSVHQVSQAKILSDAAEQPCSTRYCKPCGDPDPVTAVDEEVSDPHCSQPECAQARAAAQIPRTQDKLSQLAAAEEPVGSSHSASVTGPPAWPCLYLEAQQEALM